MVSCKRTASTTTASTTTTSTTTATTACLRLCRRLESLRTSTGHRRRSCGMIFYDVRWMFSTTRVVEKARDVVLNGSRGRPTRRSSSLLCSGDDRRVGRPSLQHTSTDLFFPRQFLVQRNHPYCSFPSSSLLCSEPRLFPCSSRRRSLLQFPERGRALPTPPQIRPLLRSTTFFHHLQPMVMVLGVRRCCCWSRRSWCEATEDWWSHLLEREIQHL